MIKKSATAYKMGSVAKGGSGSRRVIAAAVCTLAISAAFATAAGAEPQRGEVAVSCTNPYSGIVWQIKINYDQRTVDSNPAEIDTGTISWRDSANGWYYALDRKSGELTVTVASATGGNFLHDQCKLDH